MAVLRIHALLARQNVLTSQVVSGVIASLDSKETLAQSAKLTQTNALKTFAKTAPSASSLACRDQLSRGRLFASVLAVSKESFAKRRLICALTHRVRTPENALAV
jgi:hypothetical protein